MLPQFVVITDKRRDEGKGISMGDLAGSLAGL